jgi:hypothetical protein
MHLETKHFLMKFHQKLGKYRPISPEQLLVVKYRVDVVAISRPYRTFNVSL